MKLLVDMNLSPAWVAALQAAGHEAVHWSTTGDPRAKDTELMDWARRNGHIVFTNDLDFGALLAVGGEEGPSVIQIRSNDVTPAVQSRAVLTALNQFADALDHGAFVSIDEAKSRVRLLPLQRRES